MELASLHFLGLKYEYFYLVQFMLPQTVFIFGDWYIILDALKILKTHFNS